MKVRNVENFLSLTRSGLYCAAGDFYLDPVYPVHRAVVTHAHADHATRNSGEIHCTRTTHLLMSARYRSRLFSRFREIAFGEEILMNDVRLQLLPAGHMLGSSQVLMEHNGLRYLYTGDYKTQPDETAEPFETTQADILITETTFADPAVVHPDAAAEILKVNDVEVPLFIGAYAMGKAQRVTHLLQRHCPERPVFVHPEVKRYHDVYETGGRYLGEWMPYRRKDFFSMPGSICIVPPPELKRYSRKENVRRMLATGWKDAGKGYDGVLRISDHGDWRELLDMISRVCPRKIYTLHGDGSHLRNYLGASGVEVMLLDRR